jgi:heat shock protein HslJ
VSGAVAELAFTTDGPARRDRQERGSMVGSSGCNGILATFERSGDRLRVRDLETTGAPCPADLAAQETAVLAVLASDDLEVDLPPDRLVLTDRASGDGLELTSSAPLEGSTWLLREVAGRGSPEMPVTLRLANGRLAGEGPCGPYEGSYTTDGRFIDVDDLRGTDGAGCGARVQQRELLLALERAVLLERQPPRLRLLDAAGALVATFTRPPGP